MKKTLLLIFAIIASVNIFSQKQTVVYEKDTVEIYLVVKKTTNPTRFDSTYWVNTYRENTHKTDILLRCPNFEILRNMILNNDVSGFFNANSYSFRKNKDGSIIFGIGINYVLYPFENIVKAIVFINKLEIAYKGLQPIGYEVNGVRTKDKPLDFYNKL